MSDAPGLFDRMTRMLGLGPASGEDVPSEGQGLSCGDVTAVVVRVETWADVMGDVAADTVAADRIVHLQLRAGDGRRIAHAPFAADALAGCAAATPFAPDRAGFDAGYAAWRAAALDDGAGIWSLRPDAAVEAMLAVADR